LQQHQLSLKLTILAAHMLLAAGKTPLPVYG